MSAIFKNIILFLSLTTFSLSSSYAQNTYALFSPHQGPEAFEKIYDIVSKAHKYVYISIYSWSDKHIANALIEASKNGADVRVVLHRPLTKKSRIIKKIERLESFGIQVKSANKNMHEKFIIVDDEYLVNSSANFSGGAKYRYSENFIFHENKTTELFGLFSAFKHEFSIMWNSNKDDFIFDEFIAPPINKYMRYSPSSTISNIPFESSVGLYSSSSNFLIERLTPEHKNFKLGQTIKMIRNGGTKNQTWVVRDRIVSSIRSATHSIYLSLNHFNIRMISDELISAVKRGVDVRLAVDNQEFKVRLNNKEMTPQFVKDWKSLKVKKANDVPVRVKFYSFSPSPRYWFLNHHKFILIDHKEITMATTLISGSYNLSRTAEHNQFDNMVFYTGKSYTNLFESFSNEFNMLWFLNRNIKDKPSAKILKSFSTIKNGEIKLHSQTSMSLNWNEILELRKKVSKLAKGIFPISYRNRDCTGYSISKKSFTGCPTK